MNTITSRAEIAKMIAQSETMGCGYLIHVLRPVLAGTMNMIMPLRGTVMPPLYRMGKLGKPLLVLCGDDDYRTAGPEGWACASKLRSWATFAIVHGAGAEDHQYQAAAFLTGLHKRVLMIETTSEAAQLWAGFLRQREDLPFMGILPSDGPHPVMPSKGQVH